VLSRVNTLSTSAYLDETRNEVAIMTHHDAITGTSPQETADDYTRRMYNGWDASRTVIQRAYNALLPKTSDHNTPIQVFCDTLNMSACSVTEGSPNVAVTIYNPIGRPVSQWFRIPVGSGSYEIFDENQQKITNSYLVPIVKSVMTLPSRKSVAANELVFKANLPALGFVTYLMKKSNSLLKS
jgi:lysosomal alpha-mannosidase